LTPAFGVAQAYGGTSSAEYNNAVGFFMILWTVFVFTFLIASLPSNVAYILVFLFVDLGFLTVAASYFAMADGNAAASVALKRWSFLLLGWVDWVVYCVPSDVAGVSGGSTSW
jgi:succinate-acetate transporter protein